LANMQKCMSDYASTYLCPVDVDCFETMYSLKHLKHKLVDRYGAHIVFTEIRGKKNIVCFQDICSYVVSEKWHSDQVDSNKSVADPEGGDSEGNHPPPNNQMQWRLPLLPLAAFIAPSPGLHRQSRPDLPNFLA